MSKKSAIIFIVIAFIVGVILAGGSVGYFFVRRLVTLNKILDYQFQCEPEINASSMSISALKRLRSNETSSSNAVEFLELQLDYAIAGLGRYAENLPPSERNSNSMVMVTLRFDRKYRGQFPHTNQDILIQKEIEKAFSLVDDQPKH
jgi:hypothetical protein